MVVLASGLALPAVSIGLGLVWIRKRLAQVEAERASDVRALFASVAPPIDDEIVEAMLHGDSVPTFATACHDRSSGWSDPLTSLPIRGAVAGWRVHPFFPGRRRRLDGVDEADLARELDGYSREGSPRRVQWPTDR